MDFSPELDLLAFGGVQGRVGIVQTVTKDFSGIFQAHNHEVADIQFYDEQRQLLTISVKGVVCIWDAQKLELLQKFKMEKGFLNQKFVRSTCFKKEQGVLFMATNRLYEFKLQVDQ